MTLTATLPEDDRFAIPVFLAVIMTAGLLMAGLVPPFQVPDEPAHFFRVVALSGGTLRTTVHLGETGVWLPGWSISMAGSLLADLPGNPQNKTSLDRIRSTAPRDFSETRPIFVSVGSPDPSVSDRRLQFTAASYTPVPYIVPMIAFSLGRHLGAGPLATFYAGRVANLLLSSALIWLALRLIPYGRWTIALIALTPMSLHLLASYSADSLTISSSLLMVAATLRWLHDREPSAARTMIIATLLVCLCKPNCAFVLLPYVALFQRRQTSSRGVLAIHAFTMVTALTVTVLCALDGAPARAARDFSSSAQINHILESPIEFVGTFMRTLELLVVQYEVEFIGTLGWLDLRLPIALTIIWYVLLVVMSATYADSTKMSATRKLETGAPAHRIPVNERMGLLILSLATAGATFIIAYVAWTPVGAGIIGGVQGRYFLPAAPLFLLALSRVIRLPENTRRLREWFAAGAVVAGLGVTLLHVFNRYYD